MVGRWRDRLVDTAILTVPTAVITQSTSWVQGKFFAQPWQILWVALPLTAVAVVAWKLLRRPEARRISLSFAVFLAAFASVFAVASASDLLVWKRVPLADIEGMSRNWLLPVRLGDWRYWVAPKLAPNAKLTVILLDHQAGATPAKLRVRDAQVIQAAIAQHAKGVFFDVSYPGHAATDAIFCSAVRAASAKGLKVVTAFQLRQSQASKLYAPVPAADAEHTPECLLPNESGDRSRGHSMVFADVDGIVRTVPLKWDAAIDHVPLSVRIAQCIQSSCGDQKFELPDTKLLHFLPTSEDPPTILGDAAFSQELGMADVLSGRYLLVGERSERDTFATATNENTPGTMIHAYAANALLSKHYITRPPAWFSAFIVIAACCLLALLGSQNAKPRTLLLAAAGTTVVVIILAAAAMALFRVWVDVIYAVVAVWLLVPALIAYQKLVAKRGG